jgi:ADP-ribose pyrophosphatase
VNQDKKLEKQSTVQSRREIYKGRQFTFLAEKITLPTGVEAEMAFVRHPGSAVVVPLFADKSIGLIRQYRHVMAEYIYEIPAGTLDPLETPEKCARRELEEETGYKASQMIPLGKTYLLPAYSDEISFIFLAKDLTKTSQKLDTDEIIEVCRYPVESVLDMIKRDEILDALSILAICRAMGYLKTA